MAFFPTPENTMMLAVFLIAHYILGVLRPRPFKTSPWLWQMFLTLGAFLERKLNREKRSRRERIMRGLLIVCVCVSLAMIIATGVSSVQDKTISAALHFIIFSGAISAMGTVQLLRAVEKAKERETIKSLISPVVQADVSEADEFTLNRQAMMFASSAMDRFLVLPVFWFWVFGVYGLVFAVAVASLDRIIGHLTDKFEGFGFAAARLDMMINFIPARLTALFISLASVVSPGAHPVLAWQTARSEARKMKGPNAGWPLAALAGAMKITLCGPQRLKSGVSLQNLWIGPLESTAKVSAEHINRVGYLFVIFQMITIILTSALSVILFYIQK